MSLTIKQENFVQELIKGKTQRQAYYSAYPNSKKWKEETTDQAASRLFANSKVVARYNSLMDKHREKALMTREKLLEGLKTAFYMAMGVEATPMIVKSILEDGGEVIETNKKIHQSDLKAVAAISDRISKLEGWDKRDEGDSSLKDLADAIRGIK